ncbi:hypothetical protein GCM10023187_07380 [Nibrella viscosa]|uniref:Uncharacterized protein n=1 Tax=Nibrella viscosa TaxID=1084524 RepID=A0ABP8JYP9_9BACT
MAWQTAEKCRVPDLPFPEESKRIRQADCLTDGGNEAAVTGIGNSTGGVWIRKVPLRNSKSIRSEQKALPKRGLPLGTVPLL